ncbi:MAG: hypothetical protein FWC53_01440 [Firmicutes bacterium]|nr:hypothetical protein [Bacillota bacterium]
MLYGLIRGIIMIYLLLAILSFIAPMIDEGLVSTVDKSFIGGPLYRNNLILNLITR